MGLESWFTVGCFLHFISGAVKVIQDNNDNDDVVEKSSGINVAIIAPAVGVPVVLIVAVVIFCVCK